MWGTGRILTEAEKEKIKENRAKEREYNNYLSGAMQRMTPRKSTLKMKCYDK